MNKNALGVKSMLFPGNAFAYRRVWGPTPHYPRVEKYTPPDYGLISIAGPCSVESPEQIHVIAQVLGKLGIKYLRGGVFRAGTYPGNRFGWVPESLMAEYSRAAHENNMKCIIEVLDCHPVFLEMVSKYCDAYQVGARQMQNYTLLRLLARTKRPVFLKRHPGSTLDEFLGAAEHLLAEEKCEPILIERGSSSHMNHVRWDLSISLIPAIKAITKIPIICDASHGTGRRDLVEPMTFAGIAAGADGFLVEVHPTPDKSLSDADQAYPIDQFPLLYHKILILKKMVDRFPNMELGEST